MRRLFRGTRRQVQTNREDALDMKGDTAHRRSDCKRQEEGEEEEKLSVGSAARAREFRVERIFELCPTQQLEFGNNKLQG